MACPGEASGERRDYGWPMERRFMAEVAALARIEEMGGPVNTRSREAAAEAARTMWALGDYDTFAKALVWEFGPVLVEASGIAPGQRVLDVAAGTGNVAIRAAEAGAEVVAMDITPESLAAGRREAQSRGLDIDWVEGDAQALPFEDASFDVVTSSAGAIFAPDHQAVADELLRVCRPDGTIGMINFRRDGASAAVFDLFDRYAPPAPPGAQPPILWGDEDHVRELFDDRASLDLKRRHYTEKLPESPTPEDYVAFYKETFGPIVAMYGLLADQPERLAALDRDFTDFARRWNEGTPDAAEYRYDYLLVIARKR
jgi:ubiquinone/menaquinone biosynthesis C-methylase UbiE